MAEDWRVGDSEWQSTSLPAVRPRAAENVVRDGDNLILVNGGQGHYEEGEIQLWDASGSPFPLTESSDPRIAKKYGVKPDDETLDILNTVAREKEGASG